MTLKQVVLAVAVSFPLAGAPSAGAIAAQAPMLVQTPAAQTPVAQTSATPSLQVDHLAIDVADLQTSVSFYKDVFGFQQVPMPVTFAAWLSMGKGVMLHIVAGRKQPVENTKWDHLSIACADMDAMIASLDTKHVPWASMEGKHEPAVRFDGVRQIFIKDPDGYWIEINDALKPKQDRK